MTRAPRADRNPVGEQASPRSPAGGPSATGTFAALVQRALGNRGVQRAAAPIRRCSAGAAPCSCADCAGHQAGGHDAVADALARSGVPLPSDVRSAAERRFDALGVRERTASAGPHPAKDISDSSDAVEREAEAVARDAASGHSGPATAGTGRHSFEGVRVHTDSASAEAADALNAAAFTVGSDIYFGAGRFRPGTAKGDHLIAHELTHVVQNDNGSAQAAVMRYEAEPAPPPRIVIRRPAPVRPPPPPARAPAPSAPQPSGPQGGVGEAREPEADNQPGLQYTPDPGTQEWIEEGLRKLGEDAALERAQSLLELPKATTDRGGTSARQFLEKLKPTYADMTLQGMGNRRIYYTPTVFHMLDALTDDIARASTGQDVLDIYLAYFPDSVAVTASKTSAQLSGIRYRAWPSKVGGGLYLDPQRADPSGTARSEVFLDALKKRPDFANAVTPTLESIIRGLDEFVARQNAAQEERLRKIQGPCRAQEIKRTGSDPNHDAYAKFITGSDYDYEVTAPSDIERPVSAGGVGHKIAYDGLDPMNPRAVWEVKTRHEWASAPNIGSAIFSPYILNRIQKIDAQLIEGVSIANRCGYEYRWAFEKEAVADYFRAHWRSLGFNVKVFYRPR